jgi:hypothetical protein
MGAIFLACMLAGLTKMDVTADESARKPPWQRLLQGNNAKKVAEQEKKASPIAGIPDAAGARRDDLICGPTSVHAVQNLPAA